MCGQNDRLPVVLQGTDPCQSSRKSDCHLKLATNATRCNNHSMIYLSCETRMKPEPLREKSREGFCLFGKEANRCRQNQRSRVRSPAVRICVTDSTVRNTGHRQKSSTTNMGVLPTSIKNTDAHGNASVTVILHRTRCAKNV